VSAHACPKRRMALCVILILAAGAAGSACSSKQRLHQYDFRGRTLGLVAFGPAHPEVLGGMSLRVDTDDPVDALVRIGSEAAREVQAQRVRPRLSEAAARVDVRGRIAARTLEHGARHLRAEPVADPRRADYELEIRIRRYGIVAASWTSPAYFLVDAEMTLLDGGTGRRIWTTRLQQRDRVQPYAFAGGDRTVTNTVTAIALANMSTQEIEHALELLADYAADHMVGRLARGLDAARR
jgi:hypothetical protein